MGTNIDAHIEIKVNGVWHHYSIPEINRNYKMFSYLGGDFKGEVHFPSKGLPSDISIPTWIGYEDHRGDNKSPSWLSIEEVSEWAIAYPEITLRGTFQSDDGTYQLGFLYKNRLEGFVEHRSEYPAEIEDVRMVYWFN